MICDGGTCGPGCRGEGGNSCEDGQECSSTDETRGECLDPDPAAPPPEEVEVGEQPLVRGGGLQCSASPKRGGSRSPLWVLLGLGLLTFTRRRKESRKSA
jgi:MYXO-CTERM domain-containing protein